MENTSYSVPKEIFNPIYSQTEWNHAYNRMGGVYMAMLANDTPSPLLPSDEMVSIEQQTTDAANKKTGSHK